MRVILKENIENLGKKGDIVKVAPGYGRNYLIPKKLALKVTPSNMKMIEMEQKALGKRFEKEASSYQDLIEHLNQTSLSFERKAGEKDVIFGSVSSSDINEALDKLGFEVEKKKIMLDEPIKRLGNYTVPVKVYHEEHAEIKIEVLKEGEAGEEKTEEAADIIPEAEKKAAPEEEKAIVPEEKEESAPREEDVPAQEEKEKAEPAEEKESVSEEKGAVPEVIEQERLEEKKEAAAEEEAKDGEETMKEEVTAVEKQEGIEEKEEEAASIDKEEKKLRLMKKKKKERQTKEINQ